MKNMRLPLFQFLSLLVLAGLILAEPINVLAALGIVSVEPNAVSNSISSTLTITGSDFDNGAVVQLPGYGNLSTTYVNATTLTAILPAGIAPGVYSVTVVNPDSASATLPNALTISGLPPQEQPTATIAAATATPEPTSGAATVRPILVVDTYSAGSETIDPGSNFDLTIRLKNIGAAFALNVVAVFTPGEVSPMKSGGVLATTEMDPGERKKFVQPMSASASLSGQSITTVVMQISYNDANGAAYSETFNLTLAVTALRYGPAPTATPTPTAEPSLRPQLIIPGYQTDLSSLQPGNRFNLHIKVQNVGNAEAKRVTMILGGGSSTGGTLSGTPEAGGGVSGASGDFGNFAPVSSSNVQVLGDVATGVVLEANASLIVNASTNPGAYPMKISFVYADEKGSSYTDDQVITLLVYSQPLVDISFYREPDPLFAGQPGQLPLQVVNLGRKSVLLGNMKVSGVGAQFSNNTILIGALDIGGYYTLDAMAIPDMPGPLELQVTIDYTDDFNQPQVISHTLTLEVQEAFIPDGGPGMEGGPGIPGDGVVEPVPNEPESFWQKVVRFLKGLFGLDSGTSTPVPGEVPPGEVDPSNPGNPVQPIPSGGGGKG